MPTKILAGFIAIVASTSALSCSAKQSKPAPISAQLLVPGLLDQVAQSSVAVGTIAAERGDGKGCVASAVVASTLSTASMGYRSHLSGDIGIPAMELDVSLCGVELQQVVVIDGASVRAAVGGALGVTSVVLQSFATPETSGDCRALKWGQAAVDYARSEQVLEEILGELEAPDGVLSLPAWPVDLSECAD